MAQMDAFLTSHNRHHQDHCCATILSTPYAMHTVHKHSITRTYMEYRECGDAEVGGVCVCVCINRHKVTSMQSAMDFDAGFRILACVSSFKSRTFKLTTLFFSQTESVREWEMEFIYIFMSFRQEGGRGWEGRGIDACRSIWKTLIFLIFICAPPRISPTLRSVPVCVA